MRYLFILFCCLFASCENVHETNKPLILVSIPPYAFFVKQIVGEDFSVQTIVPEGVDSHTYEPTPKSLQGLERADVWFRIGDPFEEKMKGALLHKNPQLKIYDLRKTVPLIYTEHSCSHCRHHAHERHDEDHEEEHAHEHHDKDHEEEHAHERHDEDHEEDHHHTHENFADVHVWMNPKLVLQQAAFIKTVLQEQYPQNSFEEGFQSLQKELIDLDLSIRALLENPASTSFITSHPSFAYFCEEYGLQQISLEIEGRDALAKDVEKVLAKAKEAHVAVVLIEPQFSPKSAKIVAKKLQLPVKMVNPYSENYTQNLLRLAKILNDPKGS